jgi:aspartyl-tRNA synthetase
VTEPLPRKCFAFLQDAELSVKRIFCVSSSLPALPFELADAARSEAELASNASYVRVGQDTRLDNRIIDLRTRANAAIMRIASGVCQLFREALLAEGFTEIHTPKLIASASEGGADVFKLGYFGKDAFLAQSPQLYKQMVLSGDMDRVFEIGPVFRSENSHTHRHLCEFTGLDMEMTFNESYHEVLDMMDYMFTYIFDGLNFRFRKEIEAVREQYPFEDLKYKTRNSLRLTFSEGVAILKKRGPLILEKRIAASTDEREIAKMREHIAKINAHGAAPAAYSYDVSTST